MRNTIIRSGLLLGVAFAGVASANPALAQSSDDSATGDIIVTAQRIEQRLLDVPISISVLDNRQLANRNITVANDLVNYTPSLSSNERYGPEKQSFSLRGFNQDQSTAPTVGVYFAEVVGVRAQGGTTSGNNVGAGAFMDLQNVQVLKGPQGTLFGRNTTGGAILLTPHKPTDNLEGYIEGSLGNYDMKRVQGALNIPLSDTFKVRIAGDRMKRDGYMRSRSGIGPDNLNDRNYFAGRLSIVADLTPDLENYTIFQYSKSNTRGFTSRIVGYDPTATAGIPALTALGAKGQLERQTARGDSIYDVESTVDDPYLRLEQWQVINTTTWKASDTITIKNIASYGEFRETTHFDLYASNFQVGPGGFNLATVNPQLPIIVPAGTRYGYIELDVLPGTDNSAQSTFTEELQLQGNSADGKLNYTIGGYLEFSRPLGFSGGRTSSFADCVSPTIFACTNPLFIGSFSESRTKLSFDNHGVFAQASYKFTDRLTLTAGGRYTFDKITGITAGTRAAFAQPTAVNNFVDPVTGVRLTRVCTDTFRHNIGNIPAGDPTPCITPLENKSNKPTWVVNLDYKPTDDVMIYGKYARGYRQGGINFTNPGVETWGPESLDSFEVGAKTSFRGAVSGYFNLAGFYNKLSDVQIFAGLTSGQANVSGGAAIVAAGKARSYGLEADGSLTFFDSLRFDVGYAYLDTKIQQIPTAAELLATGILNGTPFIAITPSVLPGSEFTLAPKHKLTLTGTYTLPLDESFGKLSVGGTLAYQSRQIANGGMPAECGPTKTPLTSSTVSATQWCFAPTTTPLGRQPGRALVNLNINWDGVAGLPIDAAFFVTNLTKKQYFVNTGGGFNSGRFADVQVGEPRIWGFRLKYRFGN
ncbi:MAG: TonB-dependent receptor [Novosphingobium sp.]|nr:MAG: TonB-dependent receptor [Novosphingobium sp.]